MALVGDKTDMSKKHRVKKTAKGRRNNNYSNSGKETKERKGNDGGNDFSVEAE
jgi:hypothetical protein